MHWTPRAVAGATGGRLHPASSAGADATLTGVDVDSRRLAPGMLFVALRAERDGHSWVPAALTAGAGAVMVDEAGLGSLTGAAATGPRAPIIEVPIEVPIVEVLDTSAALLDLGRAARGRTGGPVVAITGSVGKTSTKDLTAAAVGAGRRVAASEKSFNNEIGVPLTLANAPESTEVAIVEMGARGPGHLRLLCEVARPEVGVVTAVVAAHTDAFGSLEAVAAAKSELVESLPGAGTAILNADDVRVDAMAARTAAGVLRYSASGRPGADVVAEGVQMDEQLRPSFRVVTPWGRAPVVLAARGAHQVGNALAALAVAGVCGISIDAAAGALARAELSPWRMDLRRARSGAAVLNDAYNANPASMSAALHALAALPGGRKVAVLGEMAELGDRSAAEHLAVAGLARSLGFELVAVDTPAYGVIPVSGIEAAAAAIEPLGPDDAVLVKASRVVGLERLVVRLLALAPA
jgi:UDP-N-acetylmuramoyl-tripeptide--D-alanyl-D-alanine ligase